MKIEEMSHEEDDESDDRRYLCLKRMLPVAIQKSHVLIPPT